jgi:uncharacterized repeat protein (TIGR03803 family)
LYRFTGGLDGRNPASGVILDPAGNLYGVSGGSGTQCNDYSPCGNVFEVSPQAAGGWTEKVLFNFHGLDGFAPLGRLVFDKAGKLYGTTLDGGPGACGCGSAYQLSQQPDGVWYEQVLYSFQNNGRDGHALYSGLVFDAAGNLYGTASEGGAYGFGTVYSLSPHAAAGWTETTLYSFTGHSDGEGPTAGVIVDKTGNLYGTAFGGKLGGGVAFELSPPGATETTLHQFPQRNRQDGAFPEASLIFGPGGRLYGTTDGGGTADCYTKYVSGCGTIYELRPQPGGGWAENILYNFRDKGRPGAMPATSLIIDAAGNFYGTTTAGGKGHCGNGHGCGVVFELADPSSH